MFVFIPIFRVLYLIVNAPCADDATTDEAEEIKGKWPALEYG